MEDLIRSTKGIELGTRIRLLEALSTGSAAEVESIIVNSTRITSVAKHQLLDAWKAEFWH